MGTKEKIYTLEIDFISRKLYDLLIEECRLQAKSKKKRFVDNIKITYTMEE